VKRGHSAACRLSPCTPFHPPADGGAHKLASKKKKKFALLHLKYPTFDLNSALATEMNLSRTATEAAGVCLLGVSLPVAFFWLAVFPLGCGSGRAERERERERKGEDSIRCVFSPSSGAGLWHRARLSVLCGSEETRETSQREPHGQLRGRGNAVEGEWDCGWVTRVLFVASVQSALQRCSFCAAAPLRTPAWVRRECR
jgi:hypothetical protein